MTGTFPCVQEAKASYKCMDDNNYDRDACLEYFKSYKECKKRMVSGMGGGRVREWRKYFLLCMCTHPCTLVL